jgi:competence protein CoiA
MQIYALDKEERAIHAEWAQRQCDYHCMECGSVVRLRKGKYKKTHFFHFEPDRTCRLNQKGIIHIHIQNALIQSLPKGDCALEYRMPAINRIADVVWYSKKIVYEIQYSPITQEEVLKRNFDYKSLGWTVVWILHEKRFNHFRLTAAEACLRSSPYYFSNMNEEGEGMIYDQFDLTDKGLRYKKMAPLPVDLSEPHHLSDELYFSGDLTYLLLSDENHPYLQEALQKENEHLLKHRPSLWRMISGWTHTLIVKPYQAFFRFLLELTN